MQVAREFVQQRSAIVGEDGRQPRRRVERVGKLEELERFEAAATGSPFDGRADVPCRADPDARSVRDERARLVGLLEAPGHDDRVRRRLERLGQPP